MYSNKNGIFPLNVYLCIIYQIDKAKITIAYNFNSLSMKIYINVKYTLRILNP